MKPLPLTVIGGYLGAGKTTLINSLLAQPHGLHLMVMVNDFGAINIDESLIAAKDDDIIALTNGCVCCTMGADLFMAIGDALDRRPRPDHLIIEASGVADPRAIANTAIAEPDLKYAGIVTLVDAFVIADLMADPLVGPQVRGQIAVADLIILTKADAPRPDVNAAFAHYGLSEPALVEPDALALLALQPDSGPNAKTERAHPAYVSWHHASEMPVAHERLAVALDMRPKGLFRIKGFVRTDRGTHMVQVVGQHAEVTEMDTLRETALVGLGLADLITEAEIEDWWSRIEAAETMRTF